MVSTHRHCCFEYGQGIQEVDEMGRLIHLSLSSNDSRIERLRSGNSSFLLSLSRWTSSRIDLLSSWQRKYQMAKQKFPFSRNRSYGDQRHQNRTKPSFLPGDFGDEKSWRLIE